jgi:hypothetical protein
VTWEDVGRCGKMAVKAAENWQFEEVLGGDWDCYGFLGMF